MRDEVTTVKCLVWDLDNTLWRGTLLEDGEVRLPEAVRELVVELDSRGILQSVASKNDHDLAWAKLEELGIAEYFVLPRIGWGLKSESVRDIAERLKFAHGTIAFVDDQPAERAEVAFHLPDVRCYDAAEVSALGERPEFRPETVTADARRRRSMYQAEFERDAEQAAFTGPAEEFLRSLDLRMRIGRATEEELTRVGELTLRTSQMNATGVHYSDATLRELLADPDHEVLVASMSDRFGPHGAVGVLLLATHLGAWHLKLLATSCRVVSFGAGAAIINWLTDQAARADAHLVADFRPTDRNRMMEIAYRFAGFGDESCHCLAALPVADVDGLRRLHLVADRRERHATIELTASDLTEGVTAASARA
ncbi:HAD-IIIC family phosphatase [Streptosporangium sp. CA-115845]|uniref:HAD-IIIC family phosphatase n=1 Tax=Streptosporangium sp. CA-115845 TaxID=3240071 RepID=UPI003D938FBD